MTEIKSTLDLILEKTKHMTLTEEEKAELRLKEIREKIKGWIQKYRDKSLRLDALQNELKRTEQEYDTADVTNLMKKELIRSVEPELDNVPSFDLLEQLLGESTERLSRLLDTFYQRMDEEKKRIADTIGHTLAEKGISGSAVVPNPVNDEGWKTVHAEMLEAFTVQRDLIAAD